MSRTAYRMNLGTFHAITRLLEPYMKEVESGWANEEFYSNQRNRTSSEAIKTVRNGTGGRVPYLKIMQHLFQCAT
jgi:hypothetical protein